MNLSKHIGMNFICACYGTEQNWTTKTNLTAWFKKIKNTWPHWITMSETCPQHERRLSQVIDPSKLFLGRVRLYFCRARLLYLRTLSLCHRLICWVQKGLLLLIVLSLKMMMVCVVCVAGVSRSMSYCFRKCVCAVRRAVSMESEKSGPSGDYNHIEGGWQFVFVLSVYISHSVCVCVYIYMCVCVCVCVCVRACVHPCILFTLCLHFV